MFIHLLSLNLSSVVLEHILQDELISKSKSWFWCIEDTSHLVLEGECELR